MRETIYTKRLVSFKHWTRKSYAVFQSLNKQIRISSLSIALLLGFTMQEGFAQEIAIPIGTEEEYDLDTLEVMSELTPELATTLSRSVQSIDVASLRFSSIQSLQDVLNNVSQVDLRQRGQSDIQADLSIRGSTFDQVQVLFNGFDITDPQTGHHSLNIPISKSQIRSVQLLSGPGSRVLGPNAYAGAVNVLTYKPISNSFDYDFVIGDFGLIDLSLGFSLKKNRVGHYVAANYSHSYGYTNNTDFIKYSFLYNGILELKKKSLTWFAAYSDKAFGANSFYTPKYPNQFEQLRNAFLGVRFKTDGKISTSNQLHYRANIDRFELFRDSYQAPAWYSHHNYHFTEVLQYTSKAWLWSDFGKSTLSLNIRNEAISSNVLGIVTGDTISGMFDGDSYYTKSDQRLYSTFSFEQVYKWKNLKVAAGLMYHYTPENTSANGFYPGIDLSYDISRKYRLFASANTGMRLPTFTDLYYAGPSNIGNPNLSPESQISYEIGGEIKTSLYKFSSSIFYNDADNSIDWVRKSDTVKWQPINISRVQSFGFDVLCSVFPNRSNIKTLRWINYINMSYSFIDKQTSSDEYMSHYVMDYLKNKFVINLNHNIAKAFTFDYSLSYHQRVGQYLQYDIDTKKEIAQDYIPYALFDVQLNWKIKKIQLYASFKNVFDVKYQDYGNVYQPGRWFSIGVKKGIGE